MEFEFTERETRILGCLIEKATTTPEHYPLSLNALVNACNQKSNRQPVVNYSEEMVEEAVDALRKRQLILQSSSGRVPKFEERFTSICKFVSKEVAVLCVLMLRGPQTVGEIKGRSGRIYDFESLEEVHETISELTDSDYMKKLPKVPGQKEARYAHLLSGDVDTFEDAIPERAVTSLQSDSSNERIEILEEKVQEMEEELSTLKEAFAEFRKEFE